MNSNETNKTQANEAKESNPNKIDYTINELMIAADTNDFAMVDQILASNPKLINTKYPTIVNWLEKSPYNPGATAINYAARSGHYDILCTLINKYGADIHSKDHENWNSLHYACYAGQYETTKYLFENGVDNTLISTYEKSTPSGFAQYKKWNDIIYLFKMDGKVENIDQIKQYNFGLIEKQSIFKKTKGRLDKLIKASNSMRDQKLCRYYIPFKPMSCEHGTKCPYAHIDIEYSKLPVSDKNNNIKLDLYMHRYEINWDVYHKLNENLCKNKTKTLVFKCIDTQLKELYKNQIADVWFIIYHNRFAMHKQRKLFEIVKGIAVIRTSSISKLDHILVLKVDENKVKILDVFAKIIGNEIDIVAVENENENKNEHENDIECKSDDIEMEFEAKQTDKNLNINKMTDAILSKLKDKKLFVGFGDNSNTSLVNYSLFDAIDPNDKYELIKQCIDNNKSINRCIGVMYGMGIGDATGAPLEFLDCIRFHKKSYFKLSDKKWVNEYNKFNLQRGQWTDDAAMGLCMADSLIKYKQFNGSDIRIRFWNWWNNGYNNAFRYDTKRQMKNSVGLGNNISKSIYSMKHKQTPAKAFKSNANKNDSGNGSLMRLAPIPIFYCCADIESALKHAKYSSFTTHQGHIAAECCALMTYIIINGIRRENDDENVKVFLDRVTSEYLDRINKQYAEMLNINNNKNNKKVFIGRKVFALQCIIKLLSAKETNESKERCWNWRNKKGDLGIDLTMINRGNRYNGYPNSEGYFGSFCMDGLAMGLHCVYNSDSFGNAIQNAVNLLGDADSTGSIAGQIAGSYYGFADVFYNRNGQQFLFKQISKWDKYDFGLRAVLLYCIANNK